MCVQGAMSPRAVLDAAKARSGRPSSFHPKVTGVLEEWFIEVSGVGLVFECGVFVCV